MRSTRWRYVDEAEFPREPAGAEASQNRCPHLNISLPGDSNMIIRCIMDFYRIVMCAQSIDKENYIWLTPSFSFSERQNSPVCLGVSYLNLVDILWSPRQPIIGIPVTPEWIIRVLKREVLHSYVRMTAHPLLAKWLDWPKEIAKTWKSKNLGNVRRDMGGIKTPFAQGHHGPWIWKRWLARAAPPLLSDSTCLRCLSNCFAFRWRPRAQLSTFPLMLLDGVSIKLHSQARLTTS